MIERFQTPNVRIRNTVVEFKSGVLVLFCVHSEVHTRKPALAPFQNIVTINMRAQAIVLECNHDHLKIKTKMKHDDIQKYI